jgi:hypothetical protein
MFSFSYVEAFVTALCFSYDIHGNLACCFNICRPGPDDNDWMPTYVAFFGLLEQSFHNVHRLRLELRMPPLEISAEYKPNAHASYLVGLAWWRLCVVIGGHGG